jgi:predicted transcriptional regulator
MRNTSSVISRPRTAARRRSPKTRQGKKAVVVYLERDEARRLKVLAAQNDTTLQALGVEAIDLLFKRYTQTG